MAESIANNAVGVTGKDGVISYECPHCGGPLHFGNATMTNCEHCGIEVQRILPPIQLTQPIGQPGGDDKRQGDGRQMYPAGGFFGFNWLPLYIALIASHSTYTSAYRGMGAAHPAHFHGVGGFMG